MMTNVKQNKEQPSIWDKVEDDLHSKVSIADAWQMAQNLGTHIAENCGDLTPQKMIRKTFVDAFGEDIGESKIKNRTRWVVLPKEVQGRVLNDLKANQLARSGGDLKQLAKALKPFRASYLELLVKGTSMEPSYLKVAVTDHTGFDLIEAICKSISEKYNLVDYYRTLISYDIGWKQFNPNVTDAQTMNRALSRFNLDSDINSQAYLDSRPAEVKKYLWPVGFSITDKSSAYGRLDETLHLITDGMYFDVLALAPTIFLGELHLPIPIFKVKLPKESAAKNWALERKDTSKNYSEEFKKEFGHLPFFKEDGSDRVSFGDGLLICDHAFKYEHCRRKYDDWEAQIKEQNGDFKISFAAGYSAHRICLTLLPNSDGTKISPHILVTGDHMVSIESYTALNSKDAKSHWYDGDRDICLTDDGQSAFFHTTIENEWSNQFSKFSSLIQTVLPVNSHSIRSLLSQICDTQGAWLKEFGLNDLFDTVNPVFYPSFDYKAETLCISSEKSIIGKLHRHLLSNEPEDCIFSELDKEAKAFSKNLTHFLKEYRRKNSEKENSLRAYFEKK